MNVPRVFICYYPEDEPNEDQRLMIQFANDLQTAGITIVVDKGSTTEDEFLQFLTRELPTCRWVLFAQTRNTIQSPRTGIVFNVVHQLAEQRTIQGIIRLITNSAANTQEIPPEWQALKAYNINQDYKVSLEKLVFTLSTEDASNNTSVYAPAYTSSYAQIPATTSVARTSFSNPPSSYDRPLAPIPRTAMFRNLQYSIGRKNLIIAGTVLLMIIVIAASFITLINAPKPQPKAAINPITGYAYFTSSDLFNSTGTQGVDDGIQVSLNNFTPSSSGNSYYAWLLPDAQQGEGNGILINAMTLQNGTMQCSYESPTHDNLLGLGSRILITQEPSNVTPSDPTPNKAQWIYYAEIPQGDSSTSTGSSDSSMDDMGSMTYLDHLRHLLLQDPELKNLSIQGGDAYWYYQMTENVMLAAMDARTNSNPQAVQNDAITILDYLDGAKYVSQDIPPKTKSQVNSQIALLTRDQENENPPGLVNYVGEHLNFLATTQGVTASQKQQIDQIHTTLSDAQSYLTNVYNDAKQIAHMSQSQIKHGGAQQQLNDMYTQSNNVYYGTVDPTTGDQQGGSIWVFNQIQHLASFTIEKYNGQ